MYHITLVSFHALMLCKLAMLRELIKAASSIVKRLYSLKWYVSMTLATSHHQGDHKAGKPWIFRDFSEHGKVLEFSGKSVQPQGKLTLCSGCSLVSSSPYAAKCLWCMKTDDLSNMGRQALVSHMSSSWCGMTLDIWRSLLPILSVAVTSRKV